MRVLIAGSRTFDNFDLLTQKMTKILSNSDPQTLEIVSGGARGADTLGEKYAQEKKFSLKIFPANWEKHGKSAGYRRNEKMADYVTHAVIFWDGKSRGTSHMINLCKKRKIPLRVIRYSNYS